MKQLMTCLSRAATKEQQGSLPEDELYMAYSKIMAQVQWVTGVQGKCHLDRNFNIKHILTNTLGDTDAEHYQTIFVRVITPLSLCFVTILQTEFVYRFQQNFILLNEFATQKCPSILLKLIASTLGKAYSHFKQFQ